MFRTALLGAAVHMCDTQSPLDQLAAETASIRSDKDSPAETENAFRMWQRTVTVSYLASSLLLVLKTEG